MHANRTLQRNMGLDTIETFVYVEVDKNHSALHIRYNSTSDRSQNSIGMQVF